MLKFISPLKPKPIMELNFTSLFSRLLGIIFILLIPWSVFAQVRITGTIKDSSGPIPGATVTEKGTQNGITADAQGKFAFTVSKTDAVLVFRMIGYVVKEVPLAGKTDINVILAEDNQTLSEVVTIGYQKITRKKSSAAISSISAKELANLPAASFDQLLQGRLSGVNVQNFTGQPGAAPTVSVRGNSLMSRGYDEFNVVNSPLYVVDGVPQPTEAYVSPNTGTGTNYLAGINPADIESIDVLKDASAGAIYGSRAANGVIMITTKKGISGEPRVGLSAYYGVTARPELRDVTLGTVERRQKMTILENQLTYIQQTQLPYMLTDSLNPAFNGNTDWQDLFYQTGRINNVDLNLSGGGAGGMVYRFSAGAYNEEGIIKATGFKRYSTRLNLTSKALKEKLTINPIIAFSRADRARGNGSTGNPIGLGAGDMPSSLFNLDEDKKALLLGAFDENLDKNISNQLTLNLNLGYEFSKNFRFTSQSSLLSNNARRDYSRNNALQNGQGNYSYAFSDNGIDVRTSNLLSYNNTFKKHSISALVGQDINYNQYQTISASGSNGAADNIQVVNGFQQSRIGAGSDYQAFGLLSYYTQVAYDYDSKYVLSLSARADGSSRFGKNNKWGYFPSASVGWLISEENFMKDNKNSPISLLKLRASLGNTGSLPGSNYLQYNLYNVNAAGYAGSGATSYNGTTAITPNFYDGVAQKNLSWQRSMQWNIGTDIEVKNGKYSMSFDVYNRETSLELFSVNLPVTTGYDLAMTNSVGTRNAGAELTLAANPLKSSSPLKWLSRLNISYNKNQIMSLPNGGRDLVMNGERFDKSHILSVGSPINAFYLYRTKGVFRTDADVPVNPFTGEKYRNSNGTYLGGMFYFEDLDGDYFTDVFNDGINPDKLPIGDPNPKYTGGWVNNFTYKNWSLGIFATFTFDRDVLNLFESDRFSNSSSGSATNFSQFSTPDLSKLDLWRNQGDNAEYAKIDIGSYRYYYTGAQTFFLEKGGYLRIKNITLGYDLGQKTLKRLGLTKVRVWGLMDNVAMFQQSKRLPDAEAVNGFGEYNGAGYPIPKKYTFGLDIQF